MKIEQWIKILEIKDSEHSELEKTMIIKCIVGNLNYDEVSKMDWKAAAKLLRDININLGGDVKYKFNFGGEDFTLAESIDDINFYQFVDAQSYLEKNSLLEFFVVFTFNKGDYQMSDRLVSEFARRVDLLKDLESDIWYPYLEEIIKKKILASKFSNPFSQMTKEDLQDMRKNFIQIILEGLNSYLSFTSSQRDQMNFLRYFMTTRMLRLFIWLLKRIKPELIIKYMFTILTKTNIIDKLKKQKNYDN